MAEREEAERERRQRERRQREREEAERERGGREIRIDKIMERSTYNNNGKTDLQNKRQKDRMKDNYVDDI